MRIALAQINPTVGDLRGNANLIAQFARKAADRGADIAVFPELSITGYPPRDLVEKPSFVERSEQELERLARETADLDLSIVCGYVARSESETGKRALNSAAVIEGGKVVFRQTKMLLPNYDVFDEARYFRPGERDAAVHDARQAGGADDLRGRVERSPVLEAAFVSARSGGGVVRSRRRNADLHQRVALSHGQARNAARHLSRGGAAL